MIGNRIMVDRWHYRQSEPSDGDIIVFKNPEGFYVLKRVIAHGARPLKAKMEWSLLMAGKFLNHM